MTRAARSLMGAGAVGLALLALALLSRSSATARPATSAAATIPTDPDFPIWEWLYSNKCDEMHPDVAYNGSDDEYLVVFDWDLQGTSHDIMAVRLSAEGQVLGSVFSISYGDEDDSYPAVARNPYGDGYLVVWQREVGAGNHDIYGAIYTDTVGTPFAIAAYADDQLYPDVAYATASHHFLVVWEDHNHLFIAPPNVRGRCLDQDGTLLGASALAIGGSSGLQYRPSLATNGFDYRWLVAWRDNRVGPYDIYGREVDSIGNCSLPGSDFVISDQAGYAGWPAVSWGREDPPPSAYGEFLVVWPEESKVFAQRVDGSDYSLVAGDPITVSSHSSGKYAPAVDFAWQQEEWWVVWQDDRDYG